MYNTSMTLLKILEAVDACTENHDYPAYRDCKQKSLKSKIIGIIKAIKVKRRQTEKDLAEYMNKAFQPTKPQVLENADENHFSQAATAHSHQETKQLLRENKYSKRKIEESEECSEGSQMKMLACEEQTQQDLEECYTLQLKLEFLCKEGRKKRH